MKITSNALVLALMLFFAAALCFAQPTIEWQRSLGGSDDDKAYSIQQTSDGGYIVVGGTYSFGADGEDVYLVKLVTRAQTISPPSDPPQITETPSNVDSPPMFGNNPNLYILGGASVVALGIGAFVYNRSRVSVNDDNLDELLAGAKMRIRISDVAKKQGSETSQIKQLIDIGIKDGTLTGHLTTDEKTYIPDSVIFDEVKKKIFGE